MRNLRSSRSFPIRFTAVRIHGGGWLPDMDSNQSEQVRTFYNNAQLHAQILTVVAANWLAQKILSQVNDSTFSQNPRPQSERDFLCPDATPIV